MLGLNLAVRCFEAIGRVAEEDHPKGSLELTQISFKLPVFMSYGDGLQYAVNTWERPKDTLLD
ncbi:hypothetical protein YTPLAS18_29930 [Nitrospira sp.]|nr:hypothetical protein YTPLAS18_29930 [Nitrospira sp.]